MALEIPEDMKVVMMQTWLPALMTTVFDAVKDLPAKHRKAVLDKICVACEDMAIAGALGIQPGMSWDDYVKFVKDAPPPMGPWTLKKKGEVVDLIYDTTLGDDGKPQCHCPFVQLGIRGPIPDCCEGGARLSGKMIGGATGKKVAKAEVIDTPITTGARVCHYRVRLGK